jgi:hypothetical protein
MLGQIDARLRVRDAHRLTQIVLTLEFTPITKQKQVLYHRQQIGWFLATRSEFGAQHDCDDCGMLP